MKRKRNRDDGSSRRGFARLAGAAALASLAAGCATQGGDGADDTANCPGGKCDVPNGPPEENCKDRQAEVLKSSNRGFTPDGIRWACADVNGVTASDHNDDPRGQEYCEYFAVVNVPDDAGNQTALDFGRVLTSSFSTNTTTPLKLCVDEDGADCRATITEDQLFGLEDQPDAIAGACVFTSWHADVDKPLPVCERDDSEGCTVDHRGVAVRADSEFLLMKGIFNNNGAASALVRDCANLAGSGAVPEPDFDDPDNPFNEPFFRGCIATARGGAGVEWRRSDPSICASVIRTVECGCSAPGVDSPGELGRAVIPEPIDGDDVRLRGFRLGTWDDTNGLPPGCRFAEIGEDTRTVVTCDLTAADLLASLNDPKEACRSLYANNVVVHVDLPVGALSCEPPDSELGKTCGIAPWNIGDENTGPDVEPPPTPDCGLHIAEVFYDAEGRDNGLEWVKLYNSCEDDVELDGKSLGWGGSSYASGGLDLSGAIKGTSCLIVGGTQSSDANGNPELDMAIDLSPDLQNSGAEADGVAIFDAVETDVKADTPPLDVVVYGDENLAGLIGPDGRPVDPHVGDAPAGGSIVRADATSWRVSDAPTAGDCPEF